MAAIESMGSQPIKAVALHTAGFTGCPAEYRTEKADSEQDAVSKVLPCGAWALGEVDHELLKDDASASGVLLQTELRLIAVGCRRCTKNDCVWSEDAVSSRDVPIETRGTLDPTGADVLAEVGVQIDMLPRQYGPVLGGIAQRGLQRSLESEA